MSHTKANPDAQLGIFSLLLMSRERVASVASISRCLPSLRDKARVYSNSESQCVLIPVLRNRPSAVLFLINFTTTTNVCLFPFCVGTLPEWPQPVRKDVSLLPLCMQRQESYPVLKKRPPLFISRIKTSEIALAARRCGTLVECIPRSNSFLKCEWL